MYKKMGDVKSVVTLYVEAQVIDSIVYVREAFKSGKLDGT
jgi:hypothetical protein